METIYCHRCSSPMHFKAFIKLCSFLTLTVIIIVLSTYAISLKGMPLQYGYDSIKNLTGYLAPSATDSVSSDIFTYNCQKEDLYVVDKSSPSNQISFIPTSQKVTCPRVLRPAKVPLPLTALMSFPGSGNTWTRHLLQQLTGIPTGSVYNDTSLLLHGFPFEGRVDKVVAVKTHGRLNTSSVALLGNFKRVIMLVRNVYDSILAESRRRLRSGNHTATVHINTNTPQWRASLLNYLMKWDKFMRHALSFSGPIFVIFYEDLQSELLPELKRMAEFLTCDYLKEFSFCCALNEREGAFHRQPNNQKADSVYSKDDRKVVNKYIQRLANFFDKTHPDVSQRILTYKMPV